MAILPLPDTLGITARRDQAGGLHGISDQGKLTVNDYTITSNRAARSGGGISHDGTGPLPLNRCTISGNTAATDGSGEGAGGGVAQNHPTHSVILYAGAVSGNHSNEEGGGIRVHSVTLKLNGSSVTRNTADERGGGAYVSDEGGSVLILGLASSITGNSCAQSNCGGGIYNIATVQLNGAAINNNLPQNRGGYPVAGCTG